MVVGEAVHAGVGVVVGVMGEDGGRGGGVSGVGGGEAPGGHSGEGGRSEDGVWGVGDAA